MRTYRIRIGWIPLLFGMAAIWVAVAGLQHVGETIEDVVTTQEIRECE